MRGTSLRSVAVALAFSLGIATAGLAGANPFTSAPAGSSAVALVPVHLGVDAATLVAELDRPGDRVTNRRSTTAKWALAMVVLVCLAVIVAGGTRWSTPPSEVAARSRILPWRAPQRAPPSLPLALS